LAKNDWRVFVTRGVDGPNWQAKGSSRYFEWKSSLRIVMIELLK